MTKMSKNINQLEKDRKEKIRNLNEDEVKKYIENLNKKIFDSLEKNNHEDIDFYNKRLNEVFDVTKGKYVNLEWYSVSKKLDITTAKMIESNTKKQSVYVSLNTILLINAETSLRELDSLLDYLLMIYYHNYYFNEASIVEDLLIHLELEYDFKNEAFSEYANSRCHKYNETLMKELNYLIGQIKKSIIRIIDLADKHFSEDYEKEAIRIMKEIEVEKDFVIQKGDEDEGVKVIKDGEYLDLLDRLKESYEISLEIFKSYRSIKGKMKAIINLDDGFADFKEHEYEFAKEYGGNTSKEDFIAMRPSYDMKKCEFVESTYFKDLGVNDE